jgi:hypothetical protein
VKRAALVAVIVTLAPGVAAAAPVEVRWTDAEGAPIDVARSGLAFTHGPPAATGVDGQLGLMIRLALPKGEAVLDLSGKFGATFDEAVALLCAARPHAARIGIAFHVGSQCLEPLAWRRAMDSAGAVIRAARVAVDIVDVGGGFPVVYPDIEIPALGVILAEIEAGFDRLALPNARLWAEPGRALVAGDFAGIQARAVLALAVSSADTNVAPSRRKRAKTGMRCFMIVFRPTG